MSKDYVRKKNENVKVNFYMYAMDIKLKRDVQNNIKI